MVTNRLKMRREDRAKQFAPFAALKGYEEALRAKEYVISDKKILNDEIREKLDRCINLIKHGDVVKVVYFDGSQQIVVNGMVSRIDITARILKVVNTKIDFKDIYDLEITKSQNFAE